MTTVPDPGKATFAINFMTVARPVPDELLTVALRLAPAVPVKLFAWEQISLLVVEDCQLTKRLPRFRQRHVHAVDLAKRAADLLEDIQRCQEGAQGHLLIEHEFRVLGNEDADEKGAKEDRKIVAVHRHEQVVTEGPAHRGGALGELAVHQRPLRIVGNEAELVADLICERHDHDFPPPELVEKTHLPVRPGEGEDDHAGRHDDNDPQAIGVLVEDEIREYHDFDGARHHVHGER